MPLDADSSNFDEQFDCVVMGGGPAGSTAAALVAAEGHRTLLVERDSMPRQHVGESLMPESYWIFERLGLLDELKQSVFPKKVGVQFVSSTGKESQPFYFRSHDPRECAETWHVDRDRFDQMMFANAARKGADCRDATRVRHVIWNGDRAAGVAIEGEDGSVRHIGARVVIDATGQRSLIASDLGLRCINPQLRKAAIWAHFAGAERDTEGGGVKTIILQTATEDAWFWYIPQSDDLVSVGVVGDNDYLLKRRTSPAETFAEELKLCPAVSNRLEQATRADEFQVAKEFSYTTSRSAGDGWVLVGDAWGFIDPIYSSGVYFALQSAELAADSVIAGLASGDTSAAQLGRWVDEFASATLWIRKLVHAFYSNQFRVGRFIREFPQHQGNLTDLLIGRIFKPGVGAIFDDLEPWLAAKRPIMNDGT